MDLKSLNLKIKNWIEWLRGLDEKRKKTILWTIAGIFAVIMGFFWVKSAMYKLENLESIDFNFPQIETSEFENSFENIKTEAEKPENGSEGVVGNSPESEEIRSQIQALEERLNRLETDPIK